MHEPQSLEQDTQTEVQPGNSWATCAAASQQLTSTAAWKVHMRLDSLSIARSSSLPRGSAPCAAAGTIVSSTCYQPANVHETCTHAREQLQRVAKATKCRVLEELVVLHLALHRGHQRVVLLQEACGHPAQAGILRWAGLGPGSAC